MSDNPDIEMTEEERNILLSKTADFEEQVTKFIKLSEEFDEEVAEFQKKVVSLEKRLDRRLKEVEGMVDGTVKKKYSR